MSALDKFGKGIDNYVKANQSTQPKESELLTIPYEYLIQLFQISVEDGDKLKKKLKLIGDIVEL